MESYFHHVEGVSDEDACCTGEVAGPEVRGHFLYIYERVIVGCLVNQLIVCGGWMGGEGTVGLDCGDFLQGLLDKDIRISSGIRSDIISGG